jgi:deazaflavin-dependent oxidoreductase (nitroreductase family)
MNTTADHTPTPAGHRYLEPGWVTQHAFNRLVRRLTRMGLSVRGSRELRVRGRSTGEWRSVPVNLLFHEGRRYLVAPRGQTQWVRNLRVAGSGELRVGRRVEVFRAVEVTDEHKAAILRAYLRHWKMEVGVFFDGVDDTASDEVLLGIAPGYPVFAVEPAA